MQKISIEEQRILSDILRKQLQITYHFDQRANFVLALSSGLFLFSLHGITTRGTATASFLFLAVCSLLAGLLSLLAIKPPRIFFKRKPVWSVMYHDQIDSLSEKELAKNLDEILKDREKVIQEYSKEIKNLVSYHLIYKKIFFRPTIPIIIFGLLGSLVLFYIFP